MSPGSLSEYRREGGKPGDYQCVQRCVQCSVNPYALAMDPCNYAGYISDGPSKSSGFWTLDYYQPYFDVDTKTVSMTVNPSTSAPLPFLVCLGLMHPHQVLRRCYTTLLPRSSSYLSAHLTPSADLYGPFWTLTTLIFALFVFSSLASSIAAYLSNPSDSSAAVLEYDFGLLSTAVGLVYAYGLGVPVLLWLALRYLGVGEWSVVEAISVWGYGQFVWIPVSVSLFGRAGCVLPWSSNRTL